jgi:thiamine-monophosphate kinase
MSKENQGNEIRTEISSIGEFGLIERISKEFNLSNPSTRLGIGDDAAVIQSGSDYLLLSKDLLLEGIHFDLAYAPLQHLGYKAIACNVSDIAAMNGKPSQVAIGLALTNRFSVEAVDVIYQGIKAACENYKVDLVGGDTTASPYGLVISVSILGTVSPNKIAYRSGAKDNDIICVTGDLGGAYMGLQILEREKAVYKSNPEMQPDLQQYEYIVKRQLKPEARMDIIFELEEAEVVPTAMIDISDGLASELMHISKNSNVGVKVLEDKIPIDNQTFETALEFKLDPITCALNGGEDYELLFTIDQKDFEKIKNHPDIHFIGHIHANASQNVLITKQGSVVPIKAQGWDHFPFHAK